VARRSTDRITLLWCLAVLTSSGCATAPPDNGAYSATNFSATHAARAQVATRANADAARTIFRGQNPGVGGRAVQPLDPNSRPIGGGNRFAAPPTPNIGPYGGAPGGTVSGSFGPNLGAAGGPVVYPNGYPDDLINPSPSPTTDRSIPLDVYVDETQTGRFMFGVGVNSDAGVTGSIVIDEQNFDWRRVPGSWREVSDGVAFRGGGQRLRLEAMPGTEVQRYMFQFREPYLFNSRVSMGLTGSFFERRYVDYNEQRLGGGINLGYNLTPDLSAGVSFRAADININNPRVAVPPADLAAVVGDNTLVGFGVSLRHDTRDSAFLATEGHFIEMKFEQVVGTWVYPRFDIDVRKYFKVYERADGSGRHVINVSGRFGISGGDTPIYDNYYAGGFSTIRGFDFRGASPRDPVTGVVLGGEMMLLGSVEYMFPVMASDTVHGVVFCDVGTVEETTNIYGKDFRVAPGFGLRIHVPAMGPAPIAIDFAFPVNEEVGDEKRVFSFFVGFNRG